MAESKNSRRKALAADRSRQALELRMAGATYSRIASALGITKGAAHKAVARAMEAVRAESDEVAEAYRDLELARLDRMQMGLWNQARSGDLAAVDRVLRIMERRSKLLGLDALAPAKALVGAGELRVVFEE